MRKILEEIESRLEDPQFVKDTIEKQRYFVVYEDKSVSYWLEFDDGYLVLLYGPEYPSRLVVNCLSFDLDEQSWNEVVDEILEYFEEEFEQGVY